MRLRAGYMCISFIDSILHHLNGRRLNFLSNSMSVRCAGIDIS